MEFPALRGRSILVVEDEPLIGMEIRAALEDAGAFVTATTTVRHALILIEHDGLAGAIMDHALGDGDSTEVSVHLKARGIPYVTYVRLQMLCESLRFSRRKALALFLFQLRRLFSGAAIVSV